MKARHLVLLFTIGSILLAGCSSKKLTANMEASERMDYALKLYENGKYFDAKTQFRIITLSHGGSSFADKAQYYFADCHFQLKEYILSAAEFERLLKIYPSSEFVDNAKYRLGLSYYKLSPKYSLDQQYTSNAILHFQEFLEEYHTSELVPEVEKMLNLTRSKLAKKTFTAADQYRKMGEYNAAIIYFTMVVERYYDTELAKEAQFYIGECYRKQKSFEQAIPEFELFLEKYPQHEWSSTAKDRLAESQIKFAELQKAMNTDPESVR